jgi:hypothetical protein
VERGDGFPIYGWPAGRRFELSRPLLASWDAATSPAQVRLRAYRDELRLAIAPGLASGGERFALGLHIGLPPGSELGAGGDLDNFLTPLTDALGRDRFVSVSASKAIGGQSHVAVGPAERARLEAEWTLAAEIETRGSSARSAWKAEIADQVPPQQSAETREPLELQLSFRLSPERNWPVLWKPAIDALGAILGNDSNRQWHPRDDRIVRLGLHRALDETLGWGVRIAVWWRFRGSI